MPLNRRQKRAIEALLACRSIGDAATQARVPLRTLYDWRRNPEFLEELRRMHREAMRHTLGRLQQASSQAVDALDDIMRDVDAPAVARVSAAKTVLDAARQHFENDDLLARLEALEAATATSPQQSHTGKAGHS